MVDAVARPVTGRVTDVAVAVYIAIAVDMAIAVGVMRLHSSHDIS